MKGLNDSATAGVKILVISAYNDPEPITSFLKAVASDKFKKHKLTDNPEEADIILFIENSRYHADYYFKQLKNHALVKKYPSKVFMYNAHDKPWFILPGLYASMPKRIFDKRYMISSPYVETINPFIQYNPDKLPSNLFSFIGSPNSPVRRNLLKVSHPRGVIKATSANMFTNVGQDDSKIQYANNLSDSKFILCPKGAGTSSFRIFETMQAGRVPVIISDDWVRTDGIEWDDFALFIPENKVESLAEYLEEEEKNWSRKSKIARETWEHNFAPDTIFNYLITNILLLKSSNNLITTSLRINHILPFLRFYFRKTVIERVKRFIK